MRIAIPVNGEEVSAIYEDCRSFKVYDVEGRIPVAVNYLEAEGDVTEFLKAEEVDGIICGGISEESCEALIEAGLAIYSGAEGNPDDAVYQLLDGDLVTPEGEYDHTGEICMEGRNAGKYVSVHYTGTFNDGTVFDSSYDRGEPMGYKCAVGLMIEGFDRAVVDMEVGEVRDIHLMPSEAYGEYNPAAVITYPLSSLPGLENLKVGQQVSSSSMGITTIMTVIARDDETITFDANHEMAGKELNFRIELIEVRP